MYTDQQIHEAYLQDEAARLALLAEDQHQPQRNLYGDSDLALTGEQLDYTPSPDDIDRAVAQLAAERGESYAQTWDQVRALAAGENDTEALAAAVVTLAQLPEGETVALTSDNLSAAEAMLLAKRGHALPDGSYAIRHKADLHKAALLAQSGHGDHKSARKLIRKRAHELGVDHRTLPGFGSGPSNTGGSESMGSGGGSGDGPSGGGGAAMSAVHQRLRRAGLTDADIVSLAAGQADDGMVALARRVSDHDEDDGDVGRIVRAHPEMFKPATHPVGKVTTKTRAHSPDEDPSDRQHPRDGGVTHPEVQRYLDMAGAGREKPSGSVRSYGPRAYRPPGPAGRPQN